MLPRLTRRQWALVALTALGIAAVSTSYFLLNGPPPPSRWPAYYAWDPATGELVLGGDQAFVLKSRFDAAVPFVPALAVPYLSFLVLVPVVVPLILLRLGWLRRFFTYGAALVVSQLAMDAAYLMFQTTVPRDASEDAGAFSGLVDLVRSGDQPFNAFPSGHSAWTTIAVVALWQARRRVPRTAAVLIPWLLLVYPATLALRQHYLVDVYTGVFVGLATYYVCLVLVERPRLDPV